MSLVLASCLRVGSRLTVLVTLVLLAATVAQAGYADTLHLPLPGKRIRNFARLEVESRWVSGNGYRPVKVTIFNMPPGPTVSDRDFRVRLTPGTVYGGPTHHVEVEAIIDMPEGSTQGTAWVAVPQSFQWQHIDIEVGEGGRRIPELSEKRLGLNNSNYPGNNAYLESMPSVLFIDSDTPSQRMRDSLVAQFRSAGSASVTAPTFNLPDLRLWQSLVPQVQNAWNPTPAPSVISPMTARANDVEVLSIVSQNDKIEILPPGELPDHWLHYTCLDLVVLTLDEALALQKSHPAQWKAIQTWATAGATLVITGVDENFQRLGELEKLLKLPTEPVRDGDLKEHGGWVAARADYAYGRVRAVDSAFSVNYQQYDSNGVLIPFTPRTVDSSQPPFAMRSLGLGNVAAVIKADPLNNPPDDMAWLLNQIEPRRWMSYQRHGVSSSRPNSDFMTFLIDGTGVVPVWSFLVLITGFVVVIGPVNYLLLKRKRRLYLLLVTVPLGAAVITISLFSYALISDGLGMRTRARSYTRLDQRSGQMVNWARQSYYAGLAPSGGLQFPSDSAVYPIVERPWGSGTTRARELAWNDEAQQLRSGYLSSRQTSQYLVISSLPSKRKLEVKPGGDQSPPQVTNQLGAQIEHLILRDHDGQYYALRNLQDGESQALTPSTYNKALQPISVAANERRPALPMGYETDRWGAGLFGFTSGNSIRYYYDQTFERSLSQPTFSSSILEMELRRTTSNNTAEIEPGTYVAVLANTPEMPIGYSRAREVGSFHVLEGKW